MNHQKMDKGKKLNKQELKSISGGLSNRVCTNSSGACRIFGPECREKKCQPLEAIEPLDPIELIILP